MPGPRSLREGCVHAWSHVPSRGVYLVLGPFQWGGYIRRLEVYHREGRYTWGWVLSGYHADTPITIKAEAIHEADSRIH